MQMNMHNSYSLVGNPTAQECIVLSRPLSHCTIITVYRLFFWLGRELQEVLTYLSLDLQLWHNVWHIEEAQHKSAEWKNKWGKRMGRISLLWPFMVRDLLYLLACRSLSFLICNMGEIKRCKELHKIPCVCKL